MTGCWEVWGGVLSAQPKGMLDGRVGGHCLPQSVFSQMVQGYPGQGLPWMPLGLGRERQASVGRRCPFSASLSPQPELSVRHLGRDCKTAQIPPSASCPCHVGTLSTA